MSPEDAVTAYNTYMVDMFGGSGVQLGAPSVTNGGAPMGLTWLSSFMDGCSSCQIDFLPLHWYDSASNTEGFKSYFTDAFAQFGKPIWVTEFGATGSDDEISSFISEVVPWMDSQDFIHRYSYFMASDGLLNTGSAMSTYGQVYSDC